MSKSNQIPLVYEVRSFHEHTWKPIDIKYMSETVTNLRKAQEERCMSASQAVVTISKAMVQNLIKRGVDEKKIFYVPNAIGKDFETGPSREKVKELKQKLNLPGKRTLGYISNFSQREGHIILLEAFSILINKMFDLNLVMVGDGPELNNIRHEVRARGLNNRVVLPGNVDHATVKLWYNQIDLFIVPRIADFASDFVTPLKPFEAMSQGIPLIMSDRPVTQEILGEKYERGDIFEAGDYSNLSQVIENNLLSYEETIKRAELAKTWVLSQRVWLNVAKMYEPAYEFAKANFRNY